MTKQATLIWTFRASVLFSERHPSFKKWTIGVIQSSYFCTINTCSPSVLSCSFLSIHNSRDILWSSEKLVLLGNQLLYFLLREFAKNRHCRSAARAAGRSLNTYASFLPLLCSLLSLGQSPTGNLLGRSYLLLPTLSLVLNLLAGHHILLRCLLLELQPDCILHDFSFWWCKDYPRTSWFFGG